jgi:excisionase family DNA binding protein
MVGPGLRYSATGSIYQGDAEKTESKVTAAPTSEWLTATEAAAYLKVKPRSLLLWVRQGKVQAYALTGTQRRVWRFRKEDLDAALLSRPVVSSDAPAVLTERLVS